MQFLPNIFQSILHGSGTISTTMKVTLELYKPGEEYSTLPLLFCTEIKNVVPRFHVIKLYYDIIKEFRQNPLNTFKRKNFALKPLALMYSGATEGEVRMIHVSFPCDNYLMSHPIPRQSHGDYHVIYIANYRILPTSEG